MDRWINGWLLTFNSISAKSFPDEVFIIEPEYLTRVDITFSL
jgi:hypothetical protein